MSWSLPIILLAGVQVEVRGIEHVRKTGKGFLLLFNHTSLLDIPILFGYFPRSFRFGAKIELFKIPFFGADMRACGVLPIDRANRNKVMKVYEEAIARVESGESFALAPEGTRQSAAQLGKFKRGPFEFAINARMDIVPVVVSGVLDVLPKHSVFVNAGRFRRKVIIAIAPPVSAGEYTADTMDDLVEKVRAEMEPLFYQLNSELVGL
jgi:1-acyl-sn-glycerol-3-phosphate acyltransferase